MGLFSTDESTRHINVQLLYIKNIVFRVNTIRDNVRDTEKEVNDARSDLSAAESTLSSARNNLEEKKREQKTVAIVGAVITPIPIIGWIAGPTMIVVSLTALEDVSETQPLFGVGEGKPGFHLPYAKISSVK